MLLPHLADFFDDRIVIDHETPLFLAFRAGSTPPEPVERLAVLMRNGQDAEPFSLYPVM